MLSLLDIPEQCQLDKLIPLDKFFAGSASVPVKSLHWIASLKPGFLDVCAINTESIRYEEIQVFHLELIDTSDLFGIARTICKKTKYPCLLVMHYQNKYVFGCSPFRAGIIEHDNNVLRAIHLSHWIYPEMLSDGANNLIQNINRAISTCHSFDTMYTEITHAIEYFALAGITKAHVDRLLGDMLGKVPAKRRDEIMKYCTPYKKHGYTEKTVAAKYDKSKRSSSYIYRYDCEDIWYCLLNYEPTKRVIATRRYRDINDLIYSVDTKLEEYLDR